MQEDLAAAYALLQELLVMQQQEQSAGSGATCRRCGRQEEAGDRWKGTQQQQLQHDDEEEEEEEEGKCKEGKGIVPSGCVEIKAREQGPGGSVPSAGGAILDQQVHEQQQHGREQQYVILEEVTAAAECIAAGITTGEVEVTRIEQLLLQLLAMNADGQGQKNKPSEDHHHHQQQQRQLSLQKQQQGRGALAGNPTTTSSSSSKEKGLSPEVEVVCDTLVATLLLVGGVLRAYLGDPGHKEAVWAGLYKSSSAGSTGGNALGCGAKETSFSGGKGMASQVSDNRNSTSTGSRRSCSTAEGLTSASQGCVWEGGRVGCEITEGQERGMQCFSALPAALLKGVRKDTPSWVLQHLREWLKEVTIGSGGGT
jgi:hypothetical protein